MGRLYQAHPLIRSERVPKLYSQSSLDEWLLSGEDGGEDIFNPFQIFDRDEFQKCNLDYYSSSKYTLNI